MEGLKKERMMGEVVVDIQRKGSFPHFMWDYAATSCAWLLASKVVSVAVLELRLEFSFGFVTLAS